MELGVDFPKTHDIGVLIALLPEEFRPSLSNIEQRQLTGYTTMALYLGEYDEISLEEAQQVIKIANAIRKRICLQLAKAAF